MATPTPWTFTALARDLATGKTSSCALVDDCLDRIADTKGEGDRAFLEVDAEGARQAAEAQDLLRKAGAASSPWAGIPVAIKDLADIQGEVTTAGSIALRDAPAAKADCPAVARLRAAGLVVLGRTNMTEFAFSGLGINPHYGTPTPPWDRGTGRVPGGSSSGSGVAIAERLAVGALGTDTGGSCRIPAAFNGICGFKPTARRVPTGGVVPLSTSLDSIGPLAATVDGCAVMDAVFAGETPRAEAPADLAGLRFFVPETLVLDGLDPRVAAAFDATLTALSEAGARVVRGASKAFGLIAPVNAKGGLSSAEAYAWHKEIIARRRADYDPRVLVRILRGESQTAADYIALLEARQRVIAAWHEEIAGFDAVLSPTVAIPPPSIAECTANDEDYTRINMLVLRNTMMINILDGCSLAMPMSAPGAAPASLMVSGAAMSDRRVLAIGAGIETLLAIAA